MNYVIIGNGPAGVHAVENIRRRDTKGNVTLISKEDNAPYSRIMIPEFLSKEIAEADLFYRGKDFYERYGVLCKLGETVTGIATAQKKVLLESGESIPFDKLLVASGSSPSAPPFAENPVRGVFSLWNKADAENIGACLDSGADRVVIIGGGLVGLQAARALVKYGKNVTVIESRERLMSAQLDAEAAALLAESASKAGVKIACGVNVRGFETSGGKITGVETDRGNFPADIAIISTGVRPNLNFAAGGGFTMEHGLVVDGEMRTNIPDVFAAGDVAQASGFLEEANLMRPLWLCAVKQGKVAGATMAGDAARGNAARYEGSVAMNSIDLFGLPVISMGILNGAGLEEIVIRHDGKGVYQKLLFREDRLTGFILVKDVRQAGLLASRLGQKPGEGFLGAYKNIDPVLCYA